MTRFVRYIDKPAMPRVINNDIFRLFNRVPSSDGWMFIWRVAVNANDPVPNLQVVSVFVPGDRIVANDELYPVVRRMFADAAYSLPGGETIAVCQERAMRVLQQIVHTNRGKKIAIGSHGAIMTLMMSCFDSRYDVDFLFQTSKPDIYRMELNEKDECIGVQRMWKVAAC